MSCLFCKIVNREIPAEIVAEDDDFLVFKDIRPKAKTHLLCIPKIHIANLNDLTPEHDALMGRLLRKLRDIAKAEGLTNGFRSIVNTGADGGQEVFHLHFHLLGGAKLPGF